jgi:hypothetical protein
MHSATSPTTGRKGNVKAFTTLNRIRSGNPCESGWEKLLHGLGKTNADDEPLALGRILEINGLSDALWALRAVDGIDKPARLFACDCAQRVAHLNPDPRVQSCIDTARRFANGDATEQELAAARVAARAAAVDAAVDAARAAAWAAAWAAAVDAAVDAARAAAWAAAWAAARAAAWAAVWAAETNEQTKLFIKYFCSE